MNQRDPGINPFFNRARRAAGLLAWILLTGAFGAPAWAAGNLFVDNNDGTVTDGTTGLMWMQCSRGQSASGCTGTATYHDWTEANGEATDASAASELSYNDWRLPALNELATLIDPSQAGSPKIDGTFFPNTPSYWTWSATEVVADPANAWFVVFSFGYVSSDGKTVDSRVRLVRGGQLFDPLLPPVQSLTMSALAGGGRFTATLTAPAPNKGERIPAETTGRWLVRAAGSQAPELIELTMGIVGGPNVAAGNSGGFNAAHSQSFDVTGLAPGTQYVLYYVAYANEKLNQMQMLAFTTAGAPAAIPALGGAALAGLALLLGAFAVRRGRGNS